MAHNKSNLITLVTILAMLYALTGMGNAQQKVTERQPLTAAQLAPATDVLGIVDVSAGSAGSKKITIDELFTGWGVTASGRSFLGAASVAAQRAALGLGTAATQPATVLGANVATALAKPTGAMGAVQLVGDVLTPTSIQLPDMTGLTAPVGYVGLKNGQLAVADNVTPGGVLVSKKRIVGRNVLQTDGKNRALDYWKLFGIPLTAAEFTAGRRFNLIGSIIIASPNGSGSTTIANITSMVFGTCFLGGVGTPFNAAAGEGVTKWDAVAFVPATNWNSNSPIKFETTPGFLSDSFSITGANANSSFMYKSIRTQVGSVSAMHTNLMNRSIAPSGVANEICFMLQIETSNTGTYFMAGEIAVEYDLTLEFLN